MSTTERPLPENGRQPLRPATGGVKARSTSSSSSSYSYGSISSGRSKISPSATSISLRRNSATSKESNAERSGRTPLSASKGGNKSASNLQKLQGRPESASPRCRLPPGCSVTSAMCQGGVSKRKLQESDGQASDQSEWKESISERSIVGTESAANFFTDSSAITSENSTIASKGSLDDDTIVNRSSSRPSGDSKTFVCKTNDRVDSRLANRVSRNKSAPVKMGSNVGKPISQKYSRVGQQYQGAKLLAKGEATETIQNTQNSMRSSKIPRFSYERSNVNVGISLPTTPRSFLTNRGICIEDICCRSTTSLSNSISSSEVKTLEAKSSAVTAASEAESASELSDQTNPSSKDDAVTTDVELHSLVDYRSENQMPPHDHKAIQLLVIPSSGKGFKYANQCIEKLQDYSDVLAKKMEINATQSSKNSIQADIEIEFETATRASSEVDEVDVESRATNDSESANTDTNSDASTSTDSSAMFSDITLTKSIIAVAKELQLRKAGIKGYKPSDNDLKNALSGIEALNSNSLATCPTSSEGSQVTSDSDSELVAWLAFGSLIESKEFDDFYDTLEDDDANTESIPTSTTKDSSKSEPEISRDLSPPTVVVSKSITSSSSWMSDSTLKETESTDPDQDSTSMKTVTPRKTGAKQDQNLTENIKLMPTQLDRTADLQPKAKSKEGITKRLENPMESPRMNLACLEPNSIKPVACNVPACKPQKLSAISNENRNKPTAVSYAHPAINHGFYEIPLQTLTLRCTGKPSENISVIIEENESATSTSFESALDIESDDEYRLQELLKYSQGVSSFCPHLHHQSDVLTPSFPSNEMQLKLDDGDVQIEINESAQSQPNTDQTAVSVTVPEPVALEQSIENSSEESHVSDVVATSPEILNNDESAHEVLAIHSVNGYSVAKPQKYPEVEERYSPSGKIILLENNELDRGCCCQISGSSWCDNPLPRSLDSTLRQPLAVTEQVVLNFTGTREELVKKNEVKSESPVEVKSCSSLGKHVNDADDISITVQSLSNSELLHLEGRSECMDNRLKAGPFTFAPECCTITPEKCEISNLAWDKYERFSQIYLEKNMPFVSVSKDMTISADVQNYPASAYSTWDINSTHACHQNQTPPDHSESLEPEKIILDGGYGNKMPMEYLHNLELNPTQLCYNSDSTRSGTVEVKEDAHRSVDCQNKFVQTDTRESQDMSVQIENLLQMKSECVQVELLLAPTQIASTQTDLMENFETSTQTDCNGIETQTSCTQTIVIQTTDSNSLTDDIIARRDTISSSVQTRLSCFMTPRVPSSSDKSCALSQKSFVYVSPRFPKQADARVETKLTAPESFIISATKIRRQKIKREESSERVRDVEDVLVKARQSLEQVGSKKTHKLETPLDAGTQTDLKFIQTRPSTSQRQRSSLTRHTSTRGASIRQVSSLDGNVARSDIESEDLHVSRAKDKIRHSDIKCHKEFPITLKISKQFKTHSERRHSQSEIKSRRMDESSAGEGHAEEHRFSGSNQSKKSNHSIDSAAADIRHLLNRVPANWDMNTYLRNRFPRSSRKDSKKSPDESNDVHSDWIKTCMDYNSGMPESSKRQILQKLKVCEQRLTDRISAERRAVRVVSLPESSRYKRLSLD